MKQIFRGGRGMAVGQSERVIELTSYQDLSNRLNEQNERVTRDRGTGDGHVTGDRVTRNEVCVTRNEELCDGGRVTRNEGGMKRMAYSLKLIALILFSAFAVLPVCGQDAVGQSDRTLRGWERSAAYRADAAPIVEPLRIGDTIPDYLWDYKMPLYKGTKIVDSLSLRDYQEPGKILILDFFTTWCGPCVESVLYVDSMINTYGYDNIRLVSVCILESTSRWTAFAKRVDWQIPTLFDWSYLHNPIQLRYDEQSGLMVIKDGVLMGSVIKPSLTKANMDRMNAGQWEDVTLEFKEERDWRTGR